MWKWINEENTVAFIEDQGLIINCGINIDPLRSWIEEGNTPEPSDPEAV